MQVPAPAPAAPSGSLVPEQPATALICRYPGTATPDSRLISWRRSRDAATLAAELNRLPIKDTSGRAFVCVQPPAGQTIVIVLGYLRRAPYPVQVVEHCVVASGRRLANPSPALGRLLLSG
ncbi:hypothetical protein [Actinomadura fulvescens]